MPFLRGTVDLDWNIMTREMKEQVLKLSQG